MKISLEEALKRADIQAPLQVLPVSDPYYPNELFGAWDDETDTHKLIAKVRHPQSSAFLLAHTFNNFAEAVAMLKWCREELGQSVIRNLELDATIKRFEEVEVP
jgi:hypothetical protein